MKAGTLEIELITNVARLQKDMRDIKRAVGDMSGSAANDIESVNRTMRTMQGGMGRTTVSSGQMRAGMQQLGFQLNDVAVQFASGTKASVIFAQQSGQVIQAVQMMTGGTSGLAKFLGGPWGIALTTAAVVLTPLIAKLFDAGNAADKAAQQLRNFGTSAGLAKVSEENVKVLTDLSEAQRRLSDLQRQASNQLQYATPAAKAFFPQTDLAKKIRDAQADIRNFSQELKGNQGLIDLWDKRLNDTHLDKFRDEHLRLAVATDAVSKAQANLALVEAQARAALDAHTITEAQYVAQVRAAEQAVTIAQKAHHDETGAIKEKTKAYEELFKSLAKVNSEIMMAKNPLEGLGIQTHSSPLDYLDLRPGAAGSGLTYRETIDNKRDNQKELADAYADEVHRRALDTAQAMADVFGNSLGGVFGKIEQILNGLGTGNFGGGKLGGVLTLLDQFKVVNTDVNGQTQLKSLVDIFGKKLDTFFGKEGSLTKVLRSAGIGAGVGAIAFGSSGGALGGAIGGALGKVAGQAIGKAIGGIAGKIGGPLGSIVGGLLGGALGSLLKKAPTGGATITNVNDKPTTFGNNDARKQAAFGAAQSVQSGILGIADQLNGMLGDFKVSIGVYKDKWRVRTDGGTKLGGYVGSAEQNQKMYGLYDFGEDQAGAIKFAIADAIRDGAITGLRAGTATLLKGEGDIERQLQKALDFENVFKELKQQTDPAGAALDDLAQQMTKLRSVFKEANASAADYAALDQLNAIKKQQILDQAAADALDKLNEHRSLEVRLMQAQGDAAGVLALQRQMELDGAKAELRPLLQQIYAAEDMADAASKAQDALKQTADKFQQYADALKSYGDGLRAGDLSNPANYRTAQVDFIKYAALARAGDQGGLAGLQDASQAFLDASKASSASALQYQRDLAQVMAAVDQAQRVATAIAQPTGVAQIAAATTQMSGTLDNIVVTVADSGAATKAEVTQLRAEMQTGMIAIAQNTSEAARFLRRWDRGAAIAITVDDALPVDTTP